MIISIKEEKSRACKSEKEVYYYEPEQELLFEEDNDDDDDANGKLHESFMDYWRGSD